ncbi:MAG: AAA family ATPase [Rickettsiales bacterium]|nr:AAA family ATPase [Rickettsiales bacterium]
MFTLKIAEDTIDKFAYFVNATAQSNALIVSGPSGIGKKHIVESFIKKQLKITNLLHHNLLWMDLAESGVQAEKVRKISDFIYKTSYDNQTKYIVLDEADKLNVFAYNSLLKILEEPTKFTIFILISSNYKLLPATIKSRCITAKIIPSSQKESIEMVRASYQTISDDDLHKYCYLANYLPFRAMKFIDKEYLVFYERLIDAMLNLATDAQKSLKEFDQIIKDVDQELVSYALNHILTKAILYVAKRQDVEMLLEKERMLIETILYLHPSMAELLLLEEKIKFLIVNLEQSSLSKQNVFLLIIYKLMYN